jgi:anti-anti-sigma factor
VGKRFEVTVRRLAGDVSVVCSGEVDVATATLLAEAVDEALSGAPRSLHIDLSGVGFLAISGMDVLAGAMRRCARSGTELEISFSASARRMITLAGLGWLDPHAPAS